MSHRYEALLLTVPEITQDEAQTLEKSVDRILSQKKGATLSFERWGKYRLAFPVRGNDYGVYFLARFEIPSEHEAVIKELGNFFKVKMNHVVMRDIITTLDERAPLSYQRPKSLEESPTSRDVNTFLKENKMEGLLSSVDKEKQDRSFQSSTTSKDA